MYFLTAELNVGCEVNIGAPAGAYLNNLSFHSNYEEIRCPVVTSARLKCDNGSTFLAVVCYTSSQDLSSFRLNSIQIQMFTSRYMLPDTLEHLTVWSNRNRTHEELVARLLRMRNSDIVGNSTKSMLVNRYQSSHIVYSSCVICN